MANANHIQILKYIFFFYILIENSLNKEKLNIMFWQFFIKILIQTCTVIQSRYRIYQHPHIPIHPPHAITRREKFMIYFIKKTCCQKNITLSCFIYYIAWNLEPTKKNLYWHLLPFTESIDSHKRTFMYILYCYTNQWRTFVKENRKNPELQKKKLNKYLYIIQKLYRHFGWVFACGTRRKPFN